MGHKWNLSTEPSNYYRSHSAEPPQYPRTQSTESIHYQRLLSGEPPCAPNVENLHYDQRLQGHPSTMSCQPIYTQLSPNYRDIQQPAQMYSQTHSRDTDMQQLFPETRNATQPEPKYIHTHHPILVNNASQHQSLLYKAGQVSPSFGQTQQIVYGYNHGQPLPHAPIEDLHPTYGHTPQHGPSYWPSQSSGPLNGNIACFSPRPSKTHGPSDPQGHADIPRLTPIGREGVESRRRASADQIPLFQREGRSASRIDQVSECLLKSKKAVLPSEIRRRERSVDDTMQRHSEDILEEKRSKGISQSEGIERGGEVSISQLDEGAGKGRNRVGKGYFDLREEHDDRRISPLGEEGNKGENRIRHTQNRIGQGDGKMCEFQERPGLDSQIRKHGESVGCKKIKGKERRDNGQISRSSQVHHHVEGQFDGIIERAEKQLQNFIYTEDPSKQVENRVNKSDVPQSLTQFEIKDGQSKGKITLIDEVELNENRNLKVDVENAEGQNMIQKEMQDMQCRQRRINQPEESEARLRRRRLSQSEDDWKARRVRRISQSGNCAGHDQFGQTGGQMVVDRQTIINRDMWEATDTTSTQLEDSDPSLPHRLDEVGSYLQSGSSLPQARHRRSRDELKPKIRTRSMSDVGVAQRSAGSHCLDRAASREYTMATGIGQNARDTENTNGEVGALDTRVSVAKLRHSYLENASGRRPELYVDGT